MNNEPAGQGELEVLSSGPDQPIVDTPPPSSLDPSSVPQTLEGIAQMPVTTETGTLQTTEAAVQNVGQSEVVVKGDAGNLEAAEIDPKVELVSKVEELFANHLREGLNVTEDMKRIVRENPNPTAAVLYLLWQNANPFGGLHIEEINPDDFDPRSRPQEYVPNDNIFEGPGMVKNSAYDTFKPRGGVPLGEVLTVSAAEYLGDDPEAKIREILGVLGDRTFEDVVDEAVKFSRPSIWTTHDVGVASIDMGNGTYLTFQVENAYGYDPSVGKGAYKPEPHFERSSLVGQLDLKGEDGRRVPGYRDVVARVVQNTRDTGGQV